MRNLAIAATFAGLTLAARPNLTAEEKEILAEQEEKRRAELRQREADRRERIRPSIEPVRENYPSRQAFREAHRQWLKGPLA